MKRRSILRPALAMLAVSALASLPAYAAEHVTLRNGAEFGLFAGGGEDCPDGL